MALAPIKWKSKIVLVKPETTYGVDSTPTGNANAVLLTDVQLQPMEGQEVSRNLELPYLGSQEQLPVGLYSVLSGTSELVGSGETGVAPGWGPLMRMSGAAQVVTPDDDPDDGSVEYSPISGNEESGSVYFWIGPNRYVMLGVQTTWELTVSALGIPGIRWTMTGLFTVPSVVARPVVVNLSDFEAPEVASMATTPVFTIGGVTYVLRDYKLTLGNDIQPRMLMGVERIIITDKMETLAVTVEAVPMNVYNPVSSAVAPAPRREIVLQHGTIVGRRVKIEQSKAVQRRFGGPQQNQNIEEWPLTFSPLPDTGNDQWKITLT